MQYFCIPPYMLVNAVNFPPRAENFKILKLHLTKDTSGEKYHLKLLSL